MAAGRNHDDGERWRKYEEESKLVENFVCSCRAGSCVMTQNPDTIVNTRHYCAAMTATEKEFFMFGVLHANSGRGRGGATPYWVDGIKVCRKMFEFIHCLDRKTLNDINKKFGDRFVPLAP